MRSGDHCEVPGCANGTFLQRNHERPHRARGDREPGNLGDLCLPHHTMRDAGLIRLVERTEAGSTYVVVATGEILAPDPRRSAVEPLPGECETWAGPEGGGSADVGSTGRGADGAPSGVAPPAETLIAEGQTVVGGCGQGPPGSEPASKSPRGRGLHDDGLHDDGLHDDGLHEDGLHEDGLHEDGPPGESVPRDWLFGESGSEDSDSGERDQVREHTPVGWGAFGALPSSGIGAG